VPDPPGGTEPISSASGLTLNPAPEPSPRSSMVNEPRELETLEVVVNTPVSVGLNL